MDLGIKRTMMAFSLMIMLAAFHLLYLVPMMIYGEVTLGEPNVWIARLEVAMTAMVFLFAWERFINFVRFLRSLHGPFG